MAAFWFFTPAKKREALASQGFSPIFALQASLQLSCMPEDSLNRVMLPEKISMDALSDRPRASWRDLYHALRSHQDHLPPKPPGSTTSPELNKPSPKPGECPAKFSGLGNKKAAMEKQLFSQNLRSIFKRKMTCRIRSRRSHLGSQR